MRTFWISKGIKILLIVILAGALMSFAVMMLWNWLMPVVFNARVISFWEALGILALTKLLFGFNRGWGGKHWGHGHYYGKEKMEERLKNMSPEERESFRNEWKQRCGMWKHGNWYGEKKEAAEIKQ